MSGAQTHRIQLQPAYVLHHRPYRDTSRIVELFTRDHGRLTVFARGVRGSKSGWAAALQSFQPLLVSWSGRGEAGQLTGAELTGEPRNLDASRLMSGFYLNELLLKLLHQHDPHPDIYSLYEETIAALKSSADQLVVLRLFEKRLLNALGFGLSLDTEAVSGAVIRPEQCYRYGLETGAMSVDAEADPGKGVYHGEVLLALARDDLSNPAHCHAVRYLLRAALDRVLEGRTLQSRVIMSDMKKY
ncbi:MAG: DNA repair protein RecO [Steroidobacter sp.]